jgi:hypothetical protein
MNVCLRFGDNAHSLLLYDEITASRATEFIDGDIEQKDMSGQIRTFGCRSMMGILRKRPVSPGQCMETSALKQTLISKIMSISPGNNRFIKLTGHLPDASGN